METDQLVNLWSHLAESIVEEPEDITAVRSPELMTEFPREEN